MRNGNHCLLVARANISADRLCCKASCLLLLANAKKQEAHPGEFRDRRLAGSAEVSLLRSSFANENLQEGGGGKQTQKRKEGTPGFEPGTC